MANEDSDIERKRLQDRHAWKAWGPYLSERQWGTVREDYSPDGRAWEYFPHEHARSRAYRWGEDGIGGFCDERQRLCLGVALWNGRDPILKERLFGLTNAEGNHGEDVKELYYYLDATPTHSYLRMLYKYPQAKFPYESLVAENHRRGKSEREYELIDTQIFDQDRYFDVEIEYAKADVDDILWRISAHNRGPEAAEIHVLPQLWFRNTWSWEEGRPKPSAELHGSREVLAQHAELGSYRLALDGRPEIYFCENETNLRRVFGAEQRPGYFKDAIHDRVLDGRLDAVNPAERGTKAAGHYTELVPAGGSFIARARLCRSSEKVGFEDFNAIFTARRSEADDFYAVLQEDIEDDDARSIQRQALAGMIWSKQFYHFDIPIWLKGDPLQPPPPPQRLHGRDSDWEHLNNADVLSMPDTWEYPWYASWDLAFHCIPLALLDAEFAKNQLVLLTREWYMHPNGQLPAYEWAFGDANPPVHAWAAWRVFQIDRKQQGGEGDLKFLERVFHKLLLNFTWWVNRKDAHDDNVFQGGFLGLDNIGIFDRSSPLPTGGHIDQADGTAWMAMYSLNLMRIALELAQHNEVYEDIATKFFEHFLYIAQAMDRVGGQGGLWDEEDGFFYDWLDLRDEEEVSRKIPLRARSMVGLIPLFAVEVLDETVLDRLPGFKKRLEWFLKHRPELAGLVSHWDVPGVGKRRLLSMLRGHRMKCLLKRMLDEEEFLSAHGVRALSRVHLERPFRFDICGRELTVRYTPAESNSDLFGGNSNWRGPVWMPLNYMIIESLQRFHYYYGDDFKVECPTGSGKHSTVLEVADELTRRLTRLFLRGDDGKRPIFGEASKLQNDPRFRDHLLFYEYFDGDNGRGVGASHQTGWTALVAKLIQPRR
ncbi:MAG: glucosidase [Polyangiales bacterium]